MFGPYRVLGKLGEGGMGVVYRARDTRLERDVALKILPDVFSEDPDRLARFEREARVLASLNHPHIAQVYAIEGVVPPSDDTEVRPLRQALVMELVEGEDLSARIARGPLPPDEALAIARQLADALEAAHDQGIIHRDLKPANVKVRDDGTVKVLDFGLAKAMATDEDASVPSAANSPTLTARATELGVILGTAAYMSPEQAKGKRVDKRADVWAFGVVLLEMLTGRRAFEGEDVSETLASVLARDPDFEALPDTTPAPVRRLIARCLQKDPKKRLRDIGDAMRRLDEELAAPAVSSPEGPGAREAPRSGLPGWILPVAALAVGVAAGGYIMARATPSAPPPDVARFSYQPPPSAGLTLTSDKNIAISPDGRLVAYSHRAAAGTMMLALRQLDESLPIVVQGSENASDPFFSPDGQSIGFVTDDNVIRRIPVSGGRAQQICVASGFVDGATWTADGRIIFAAGGTLYEVPETGGQPVALTTPVEPNAHYGPTVLPGGRTVVFVEAPERPLSTGRLAALDLGTGDVRSLDIAGVSPRYVASGHLIYATEDGSVWAVPFDVDRLTATGAAAPVLESVGTSSRGVAEFDVSDTGHLIYVTGGISDQRRLIWVDQRGEATPFTAPPRAYVYAWISPDETRLALDIRDAERDIWLYDLARNTLQRRSVTETEDEYGIWTRDGTFLIFSDQVNLYRIAADGTGRPEPLTSTDPDQQYRFPNTLTTDDRVIFRGPGVSNTDDLFVVPLDGSGTISLLLGSEFTERNAAMSPDGRWMAYESDMSGTLEVYVRPYPDVSGGLEQISSGGGSEPAWSRDGRALFYLNADQTMMRVPVDASGRFTAGSPVRLFDASRYFFDTAGRNYDVASDGRFVMIGASDDLRERLPSIEFVLNWTELLRPIR